MTLVVAADEGTESTGSQAGSDQSDDNGADGEMNDAQEAAQAPANGK